MTEAFKDKPGANVPPASDIAIEADGSRTVRLYIPFDGMKGRITHIRINGFTLDDTLSWKQGKYRNIFELLYAMVDVHTSDMRMVRYPDVDRVLQQFTQMLPTDINDDVQNGRVPDPMPVVESESSPQQPDDISELYPEPPPHEPQQEQTEVQTIADAPGAEFGFDMSDNPRPRE